jgi:hypothetical protein
MNTNEHIPNGVWLDNHAAQIDELTGALKLIDEQNKNAAELDETLMHPELKEVADNGFRVEQTETLTALGRLSTTLPWEDAFGRWSDVENDIASFERNTAPDNTLLADKDRILRVRPDWEATVQEAVGVILTRKTLEAQAKRDALLAERKRFATMFQAWPIPNRADPHVILEAGKDEDLEYEIEEVFPFNADLTDRASHEASSRESHGEKLENASEKLANILVKHAGKAFTTMELADLLYGDELDPETSRPRTSALISNHFRSRVDIIKDILDASGLVLQRGKRTIKNKATGEVIHDRIIVFRASEPTNTINVLYSTNGKTIAEANWRDIRAIRESEGAPKEIIAENEFERQIERNFRHTHLPALLRNELLSSGIIDIKTAYTLLVANAQYPTEKSMTGSKAWKAVISNDKQKALANEGNVALADVLLFDYYESMSHYFGKSKHRLERARKIIQQEIDAVRSTMSDEGEA